MTIRDLILNGLHVTTDTAGHAYWQDGAGVRDEGPINVYLTRVVEAVGPGVAVYPRVVFADEADDAAYAALRGLKVATVEVIDGPIPLPDVDDAIVAGLTFD